MSLQPPDAQSSRFLSQPQYPQSTPVAHSIPPITPSHLHSTLPSTPQALSAPAPRAPQSPPTTELSNAAVRERATEFADHSWDLGAGGLKTLTAKRELPPGLERRASGKQQEMDATATARSNMFTLVILACIVVMLISGGIVLFMMLQP